MPFRQDSPRRTTPAPAAPVPPPNPAMPPLSGAERLERIEKGYRPPENYWEEDKPPIKFPFEGREIPGLPEGMTLPPRQPLEDRLQIPPFDFQEKMKGLMDRLNEEDVPPPPRLPQPDMPPEPLPWELLTPEQRKWVI